MPDPTLTYPGGLLPDTLVGPDTLYGPDQGVITATGGLQAGVTASTDVPKPAAPVFDQPKPRLT